MTAFKKIATALGKPYSEVAGVVSFYSFFTTVPRGKHLVRVCLGTACFVRGSGMLFERLEDELEVKDGGTDREGRFTLRFNMWHEGDPHVSFYPAPPGGESFGGIYF